MAGENRRGDKATHLQQRVAGGGAVVDREILAAVQLVQMPILLNERNEMVPRVVHDGGLALRHDVRVLSLHLVIPFELLRALVGRLVQRRPNKRVKKAARAQCNVAARQRAGVRDGVQDANGAACVGNRLFRVIQLSRHFLPVSYNPLGFLLAVSFRLQS